MIQTEPPGHGAHRSLAVVLKGLLAGPQFQVWETAARICAEAADQASAEAETRLLAAAAIICASNSPDTNPEIVRRVVEQAASLRPQSGSPDDDETLMQLLEAEEIMDHDENLLQLAERWIDDILNPGTGENR